MSCRSTKQQKRRNVGNRYSKVSLAIMAATSMYSLHSFKSASAATAVFNAVGVLDPNNGTALTVQDAGSNTATNGVTFANFSTLVGNSFAANNGGVLNFGDGGTIVNAGFASGTNQNGGPGTQFQTNLGTSGNSFSFYRDTGGQIAYNTDNSTYLASGGAGGYYLGQNTNANETLTFVQGLADFGITFLPRSNAAARTAQFTVNFSDGTHVVSTNETTNAGGVLSNKGIFFGFAAPTGLTITSVSIAASATGNYNRFDDLAFVLPTVAAGTPYYWTASTNNSWASNNWSSDPAGATLVGAIPTTGAASAVFAAASVTSSAQLNTVLGSNQNVGSIAVNTSAGAVVVGGTNNLTIGAAGISMIAGGPLTINTAGQVILGTNQTWTTSNTNGTGNIVVSSPITGAGSLGIAGTGTVLLSGTNSFTGGTIVKVGTLQLGSASALGASTAALTVNGGTLDLNGFNTSVGSLAGVGGVITSSGAAPITLTVGGASNGSFGGLINDGLAPLTLVRSGAGQLILGSTNGYSGGTTITAGELRGQPSAPGAVSPFGTGTVNLNGGLLSLYINANTNVDSYANNFNLNGGSILNVDGDIHLTGTINVLSNSTIDRTYGNAGTGKKLNIDGLLVGSANIALYNQNLGFGEGGNVNITNNANPYSGTITVNSNLQDPASPNNSNGIALIIGGQTALQFATVDVEGNGTTAVPFGLGFYAGFGITLSPVTIGALQGNGRIALQDLTATSPNPVTLIVGNNNASTTYSGALNGSGGLTKTGTGVFTLSGSNTYTGGTTLAGGVLVASAASIPTAGNITFTGGTLRHAVVNPTDYSALIQNSSSPISIDTNGQTVTYASSLGGSNSGGLTKFGAGTLNLTAAANYSGDTNINAGTLGIVSINNNGTVFVNSSNTGSGTLTATGAATIGGLVNVAGGGAIDLRNGTIDTLSIAGGLNLSSGSVLGFEVGAAATNDSITLTGGSLFNYSSNAANGATTVNVARVGGFQPGTYNLITNASGIVSTEFSLGTGVGGYNLSLGVVKLGGGPSNDTLQLTVVATAPLVEFWHGGRVAGAPTVWSASSGGVTNWDTDASSNISAAATPSLPTAVIFSASAASPGNQIATILGADTLVKSIEIQTSNPVGIGGANTLTIDQGLMVDSGAGATTLSATGVVLNLDQTWTNNSVNLLSVSSNISGNGRSLTIAGTGTTSLSGTNTFNGSLGVSSGATLSIGSAQALGLGSLAVNGTLNLSGQTTTVVSALSGSGTVTNSNAALATLSVAGGTFSGAIQDGLGKTALNLSAGTLTLTGTSTATGGTTIGTGATLKLGDGSTTGTIAGPIANAGTLALLGPGAQTIGGIISGTGTLSVNSPSTVILSGANTYTGNTIVTAGTLQLGSASALGSPAAKVTINGGTVDMNGFNTSLSALNGAGGAITSSTASAGTTTLTIAASGNVSTGSYAGSINDGGGKVALNVNAGGVLTLTNTNSTYSGGTVVNGGGTLNIGDATSNASVTPDNTLGSGPVTIGSATTPVATFSFRDQIGGNAVTLHTFANSFAITGNTLIQDAEGTNVINGPITLNGSNNTIGILLNDKPLALSGPLSGSGNATLVGYGKVAVNVGFGGGGYVRIGNNTSGGSVDNTGFTGTLTENNTLTTDNIHGAQIVALQNAFLPNGTIAFTADLPVVGVGPVINGFNPFNSSAVTFAPGVTAPQIGALSSSTGGAIALATQALEGVSLTLGLNNSTGSTYAGNLYDNSKAAAGATSGSLTKVGTNMQILTGVNTYAGGTTVAGGTLSFASPAAFPTFTSLTIGANALAIAANHGASLKNNLFTSGLSISGATDAWTGKLDLANNDMVVQNGALATITSQVKQGFNGGSWNNVTGGIVSSAAAADATRLTALGVIQNSVDGTTTGAPLYSASNSTPNAFDGATASAATDVLVKYTYYGDANLDGRVDGSDYSRIDAGYLSLATGWYNGDFNYDGVVNGSDYTLIDNAFNSQGARISALIATPTSEIAGASGGSSVPEPASLGLLALGVAGLLGRRRRH